MDEEWRDINEYEGLYKASNLGRVKSLKRIDNNKHHVKERILSCGKKDNGYLIVSLWKDGVGRTLMVHRLVAMAFIDNTQNYNQINHIDEDKSNNSVINLEWCTNKHNMNHNNLHDRITKKINYSLIGKKRRKKVYQYNIDGTLLKVWDSAIDAKLEGYSNKSVSRCCRGERRTYKNHIWSYYPNLEVDYGVN